MKPVKKKILIASISVVVLALLALAVYGFAMPVFKMATPLPEFPETIQIYKYIKPVVTGETTAALGAKLGISGEVAGNELSFLMTDKETGKHLMVFRSSGAWQYTVSSKLFPSNPDLPSEEEAARIATVFLDSLGYLFEGVTVKEVVSGGSANGVTTLLLVRFNYPLAEYKFAANKYGVRIGDGGEVVDAFINPVRYEPYKTAQVKPVTQAYNDLIKTRNKFTGIGVRSISISSVSIEYWLEGVDIEQNYIYPVYVFRGGSSPGQRNYVGFIDATQESSIDFPAVE